MMTFEVKWEARQLSPYIYGSTIEYLDSGIVHFKNSLLAPGTPIVKWESLPSFQSEKTLLQLPLLKRGKSYHFSGALESVPEQSVLLKVDCFDRSGVLVSTRVVPVTGGTILYPATAFSYAVALIGTGVKALFFHSLLICEDAPEEADAFPLKRRRDKTRGFRFKRKESDAQRKTT